MNVELSDNVTLLSLMLTVTWSLCFDVRAGVGQWSMNGLVWVAARSTAPNTQV